MPKLASSKYCTGCLACVDACNHGAIQIVMKNGMTYVKVKPEKCVNCKLCEKACPIVTPVRKNDLSQAHVYGGWAQNEQDRLDAASGGAFTGLAHSFFHSHKGEKVAVAGANLANNHVSHIMIEHEEDIPLLANSKYIQSDTKGIYKNVSDKLKAGYWVMFSGCPCQIAALYGVLGKKRDNERLITIEVVCHGIACQEALDLHLKYYHSPHIYSFRDKKVESLEHTVIIQGNADYLYERNSECQLLQDNVDPSMNVTVSCDLSRNQMVETQYFNLINFDSSLLSTAFIEAGGIYPNAKAGDSYRSVQRSLEMSGYECKVQ